LRDRDENGLEWRKEGSCRSLALLLISLPSLFYSSSIQSSPFCCMCVIHGDINF
jgi:hypothetical protein